MPAAAIVSAVLGLVLLAATIVAIGMVTSTLRRTADRLDELEQRLGSVEETAAPLREQVTEAQTALSETIDHLRTLTRDREVHDHRA